MNEAAPAPDPASMTAAEAHAAAESEGLALLRSDNVTGFRGVRYSRQARERSTHKDFVSWLDAKGLQFVATKRLVWPTGKTSPGTGVLTHVMKMCPGVVDVDIRGLRYPQEHYGGGTQRFICYPVQEHIAAVIQKDGLRSLLLDHSTQLTFIPSSFMASNMNMLNADHFRPYFWGHEPSDWVLPPSTERIPVSFGLVSNTGYGTENPAGSAAADESIWLHAVRMEKSRAVQWNFPEMRHLELQFLPIEHLTRGASSAGLAWGCAKKTCWRLTQKSRPIPLSAST